MNAQQLKNSILQRAIEGKLVEQRPEEGTAAELLKEIKAEKARLVKEGKLKKEKPLRSITAEEIPFEIPESWEWVRLNDLVCKEIKRGKSPVYAEKGTTLVFAQKCNTKEGKINLQLAHHLDEQVIGKYSDTEFMCAQDIIINSTGIGTLGRIGILTTEDIPSAVRIVPDSHVTIIRISRYINTDYIYYMLKRQQSYLERLGDGSTKQKELKAETIKKMLVPLPPLAEQKRIVAKIEELLAHVERYGKAHDELAALNEKFPDAMKKSVLQYAMEGKLVEQREEEGTAKELLAAIKSEKAKLVKEGKLKKEKPLPEIKAEEIPFEIPESWEWVYINDIAFVTKLAGFEYTKNIAPNLSPKGIPLLKGKNIQNGKLIETFESYIPETISNALSRSQLKRKCLLTPYVGTIGNIAIFKGHYTAHLGSNVGKIELFNNTKVHILEEYVLYYFRSYTGYQELIKYRKATAQESISIDAIRKCLFPLPPLAEQKRIVAKIEELLACCGALEK